MYQGTTPVYTLVIDGYDLTDKTVFVTLKGQTTIVTKTGEDLSVVYEEGASTIAFRLTQEETLSFSPQRARIQVRFIDSNGVALATDTAEVDIKPVLLKKVIAYEGVDAG